MARASEILYSLIETAKANGLRHYIAHCLEKLCNDDVDVEKMLPWNAKLSADRRRSLLFRLYIRIQSDILFKSNCLVCFRLEMVW